MVMDVQGAPEKMREMCIEESVPTDFSRQLTEYTQCGYRVIAMAGKALPGLSWEEVSLERVFSVVCLRLNACDRLRAYRVTLLSQTWFSLGSW